MKTKTAAKEIYIYDASAKEDAETIDVALFVSTGDETEDGVEATFYVAGDKVTYVVADMPAAKAGQLFEIEIDEDEIATITALEDLKSGEIDVVSDDYIVVDGEEIALDDDCAVYQVSKNGKTVSEGELEAEKDVVVITNSDDEAVEIYIYKDITILG